MKKIIAMLLSAALMAVVLTGCGKGEDQQSQSAPDTGDQKKPTVVITVKDYGQIEVELDPAAAPVTVNNFMKLVKSGFYDGLTFHRIIPGFMIQGGDPEGDGTGGSRETIKGEFSENGVDNPLKHVRGTISMARTRHPDSARSQFFIVHQDTPNLDGRYAAFGHVTSGIEVVDAICEAVHTEDDNGTVLPANQPVIESIKVKAD